MNTFDDDNDAFFTEPRRRPPRERAQRSQRRPPRSGQRRSGPPPGQSAALRLGALLVLGILVVFGIVVSCGGDAKGEYKAYFDSMRSLAHDSASVGAGFATDLKTQGLTMDKFTADLTSWAKQEQSYYVAAQRLRPPGPLQTAHTGALWTFYFREAAFTDLLNHLVQAKERHDRAPAAAALLASDAQLLSTSDTLWAQYQLVATQVLTTQKVTGVGIVPPSQIVTDPNSVSAGSLGIVYQLLTASTSTDGGRTKGPAGPHDIIVISTSTVLNGTTTALSPTTSTTVTCCSGLEIDVVFEDSGQSPVVSVPVTLTVKSGNETAYTHTTTVPQIAAGTRATAQFPDIQLQPGAFGHNSTITVSIPRTGKGEARLDNNTATYPVLFLYASG